MLRGDDPVGPYWLERQLDPNSPAFIPGAGAPEQAVPPVSDPAAAGPRNRAARNWTMLGTLSRPERAAVDERGLVCPGDQTWSLDWWIGAEDRWYLPSREVGVRQHLIGEAPVTETAMRIRRGDALHRCYATTGTDGDPWLVVEIQNASAAAVAVALVLRPWSLTGPAQLPEPALEGNWVTVGGIPVLALGDQPAHTYLASPGEPSVLTQIAESSRPVTPRSRGWAPAGPRSVGTLGADTTCWDHGHEFAVVMPLAHTLTLTAAISLGNVSGPRRRPGGALSVSSRADGPADLDTGALASHEQVASGWATQVRRGAAVELPDERLGQLAEANLRHLLLAHAGEDLCIWPAAPMDETESAAVLGALDGWGFGDEVSDLLAGWEERQALDGRMLGNDRRHDTNGAALASMGEHWRLSRDESVVKNLVGPIAKAAQWIDKRATSRRRRSDPSTVGLPPDGDAPGWAGFVGVNYHDAWWSLRGLRDTAMLLAAGGQPEAASDAADGAVALETAITAALAADAERLGDSVVPAGPQRQPDGASIGILEAVLLGLMDPSDQYVEATLEWIRSRHVVSDAIYLAVGAAGLSPRWTARLARVEIARSEPAALTRLAWLASVASPGATWPEVTHPRTGEGVAGAGADPVAGAEFLMAVRDLMVREDRAAAQRTGGAVLDLLALFPREWAGRNAEARDLPTSVGTLGFSLRWHGQRPALIWELEPHEGLAEPVTLRAPGLDGSWSSNELSGEALLEPLTPAAEETPEPAEEPGPGEEPESPTGFS